MKINTKKILVNLVGEELIDDTKKPLSIGSAIAGILLGAKGPKLKMFNLATNFYSEPSVDLDDADTELVRAAIESCDSVSNLITGQILSLMSRCKE